MFTNSNLLGTIAAVVAKTPSLKVLIYDGAAADIKAGALESIAAAHAGIRILTLDEFLALGKANPVEPNHPKPEDTCCVMYTSGSTGSPKGVLISNGNIVAAGESFVLEVRGGADDLLRFVQLRPSRPSLGTSSGLESPTSLTFLLLYVFPDALSASFADFVASCCLLQHIMEFTVESTHSLPALRFSARVADLLCSYSVHDVRRSELL